MFSSRKLEICIEFQIKIIGLHVCSEELNWLKGCLLIFGDQSVISLLRFSRNQKDRNKLDVDTIFEKKEKTFSSLLTGSWKDSFQEVAYIK